MNQLKKFWASVKGYIASARKAVVGMTTKVVTKLMSIGAAVADSINAAKNTGVLAVTMGVATVHEKATALVAKINAWTGESLARFILVLPLVAALQLVQATMWLADKALLGMLALTVGEQIVLLANGVFIGMLLPILYGAIRVAAISAVDTSVIAALSMWLVSLIAVLVYGAGSIIRDGIRRGRQFLVATWSLPAEVIQVSAGDVSSAADDSALAELVATATETTTGTEEPVVVAMRDEQPTRQRKSQDPRRSRRSPLLRALQEEYSREHGELGLEG